MTAAREWLLAMLTVVPLLTSAQAEAPAGKVIVSGFEPFGGRSKNASWTLATEIQKAFPSVEARAVPVVWGAPLLALQSVKPGPAVWIAFGEGTPTFQIEVLAHNSRGRFKDNLDAVPGEPEIVKGGAKELRNAVDAGALAEGLCKQGFPTRVSQNAGRYLCEEMLYSLLHMQRQQPENWKTVLFIHVPVLGQEVTVPAAAEGGSPVKKKVDDAWLREFGKALATTLQALDLATLEAPARAR